MSDELLIRHRTRPEVDTLVGWAAREDWNPGLHEAELFWTTDPVAFIAAAGHRAAERGGGMCWPERQGHNKPPLPVP